MKELTCYITFLLFFTFQSIGQNGQSPFKAGASLGLNLAQIDGDRQFGYKKKGFGFGLRGGVILNRRLEIQTELLYNFKGSLPSLTEKSKNRKQINFNLHYAEVPILLKLNLAKSPETGYFLWEVYTGVSYGRLLKSKFQVLTNNNTLVDTAEMRLINLKGFKTSDINFIFGVSRYFSPRFGVSVRHTSSFTLFYDNPFPKTPIVGGSTTVNEIRTYAYFRNFFFSFNVFYDFIAPKQIQKKVKKGLKFQNN